MKLFNPLFFVNLSPCASRKTNYDIIISYAVIEKLIFKHAYILKEIDLVATHSSYLRNVVDCSLNSSLSNKHSYRNNSFWLIFAQKLENLRRLQKMHHVLFTLKTSASVCDINVNIFNMFLECPYWTMVIRKIMWGR